MATPLSQRGFKGFPPTRGRPPEGAGFVLLVEGVGFEPTNSEAERIYSPRPLATWIPFRRAGNAYLAVRRGHDKRFPPACSSLSAGLVWPLNQGVSA